MPVANNKQQGVTNYQGRKRGLGVFHCLCGNSWFSVSAWANTAQKCRICNKWTFPFKILKYKRKGKKEARRDDPDAQHDYDGCQMCLRLRRSCRTIPPVLPKDVYQSQKKQAEEMASRQNIDQSGKKKGTQNLPNGSLGAKSNGQNGQTSSTQKQGDLNAEATKKKKSRNRRRKNKTAQSQALSPSNPQVQPQVQQSATSQSNHTKPESQKLAHIVNPPKIQNSQIKTTQQATSPLNQQQKPKKNTNVNQKGENIKRTAHNEPKETSAIAFKLTF